MRNSMKKAFTFVGMCAMFLTMTFSVKAEEKASTPTEIKVQGLDREKINEITEITGSLARSSCGINHVWEVKSVVQEGSCDKEGVYKVQCVNCGATGTVTTDAPGHNYVNGVCSVCGEKQQGGQTDSEVSKWEYTIDETAKTITLDKYISNVADVVIYGSYKVNGAEYTTKLRVLSDDGYRSESPFDENEIISSVKFRGKVVSRVYGALFLGCKNLREVDFTNFVLDSSDFNNFVGMFYNCISLRTIDWGELDTSTVISMRLMFWNCSSLESIDLSHISMSKVTTFNAMLEGCKKLKDVKLGSVIAAKDTNMSQMFKGCTSLTGLDLSGFTTFNVTNMDEMFRDCANLTNIYVNRMNWNTSYATTTDMFTGCGTSKVTPR